MFSCAEDGIQQEDFHFALDFHPLHVNLTIFDIFTKCEVQPFFQKISQKIQIGSFELSKSPVEGAF